jgi:hypothetical protein
LSATRSSSMCADALPADGSGVTVELTMGLPWF